MKYKGKKSEKEKEKSFLNNHVTSGMTGAEIDDYVNTVVNSDSQGVKKLFSLLLRRALFDK